jgi:hypothetical protein
VNCSLQKTFLGISTSAQTINSIRAVEWSEDCDDEGCAYALVLHLRAGTPYTVRATESDKAQFPKFIAFVQGEEALPEITLAVGGNWFEWLTLIGIGLIIASGFFIPWFLERRASKN